MLLVDTQLGLFKTDVELKKEIVAQRPVQKWIQNQVHNTSESRQQNSERKQINTNIMGVQICFPVRFCSFFTFALLKKLRFAGEQIT